MPRIIAAYVRCIDGLSTFVGRIALHLIWVILFILLYSTVSRYFFDTPVIWGVEMAQFVMVAYYILGGGFALLINSHVRLDIFYGRLSPRRQALTDAITSICLLVYLGFLLYGCISSTMYSIQYNQHNNTAWGPAMWPIKVVLAFGILVTLLQAISEFCKAVARARGIEVHDDLPERRIVEQTVADREAAGTELPPSPLLPGLPLPELALHHLQAVRRSLSHS